MQPELTEKLERTRALVEVKTAMKDLYFKYDSLSDDDAERLIDTIQANVQLVRSKVQERRTRRNVSPNSPTS